MVLGALFMALMSGCASKLTASHLVVKPWEDGGSLKIFGKFMHFDLTTQPGDGGHLVKGTAWPIKENIPLWADTAEDLSLFAYLCDEKGNVLATAQKHYPTQKITASGFPFEMTLATKTTPSGGFFVAMGYRVMFTASKPPTQGGQGSGGISGNFVFFANEQAAVAK